MRLHFVLSKAGVKCGPGPQIWSALYPFVGPHVRRSAVRILPPAEDLLVFNRLINKINLLTMALILLLEQKRPSVLSFD